jgi:hypothetical protein
MAQRLGRCGHSPVRRILVSCLEDAGAIYSHVWAQLQELGWLGTHTGVVIVGDARRVDLETRRDVARRCEILDFWHTLEHAWELPCATWRRLQQAGLWVHQIAEGLHAGKVHQVIARFQRLRQPGMRWSARSAPADSWLCAYFCRTTTGRSSTNSACSLFPAHGCSIHALDP